MLQSRIGASLVMANSLQKQVRMKRIRYAYVDLRAATIKVQNWYRACSLRNKFRKICRSIVRFQAIVRGKQGRRDFTLIKDLIHQSKLNTVLIALQAKEKLWLEAIQQALIEKRKIKLKAMQEERRKCKEDDKKKQHTKAPYNKGKKDIHYYRCQTVESLIPIIVKVDKDISQGFPLGICAGLHKVFKTYEEAISLSPKKRIQSEAARKKVIQQPLSSQETGHIRNRDDSKRDLKQIVIGDQFCACLDKSGYVYTFGDGKNGALGHGGETRKDYPTLIHSLHLKGTIITKLAAGSSHFLMLADTGALYGCGGNNKGQLGIATPTNFGKSTLALSIIEFLSVLMVYWTSHSLGLLFQVVLHDSIPTRKLGYN